MYWLLLLDVHYSNRDREMRMSLQRKYDTLFILFVPSNCTSVLQPMDVSFNAPFKKLVKKFAVNWLTNSVADAVSRGTHPADVHVRTTKTVLVRPFCAWVNSALEQMAGEQAILDRGG
jgi:hypothetical protein